MKKWMTVVFASMFAFALSMPAWSQSTAPKTQTASEKKADKDAKKEAAKKKKADKKAAAKKAQDDKSAKATSSKK
jgi:hypothetical protein